MQQFNIVSQFKGYNSKDDPSKLEPGTLTVGSQNVLVLHGDSVDSRQGYSRDGQIKTGDYAISNSYDWITSSGSERNLRGFTNVTGTLQYRYKDANGVVTWRDLLTGLSSVAFNYAEYRDTVEVQDVLLFVNGTNNVYAWSGGITTVDSVTTNTIKKTGGTSWLSARFVSNGSTVYDKKVVINGTTYTYTGGDTTDTLTGVTPDPSLAGVVSGDIVHQAVTVIANSSITGLPATFGQDLIYYSARQIYYASTTKRDMYISKVDNFLDCSFSSPRIVGEGAKLTLGSTPTGFTIPNTNPNQAEYTYISTLNGVWYQTKFTVSSDNTKEIISVIPIKATPQYAAENQNSIANMKNAVVFISKGKTLEQLSYIANNFAAQSLPISYPIKPDFDSFDFTGANMVYWADNLYIAIPRESKLYIRNNLNNWWEAPQIIPAGRVAIIEGNLYIHSNSVNETYKYFDGYSDGSVDGEGGNPYKCVARFNNTNGGVRQQKKRYSEIYSEGYITPNTTLSRVVKKEYNGCRGESVKEIVGATDQKIIFAVNSSGSLGKKSLGKEKLGGTGGTELFNKFRVIHDEAPEDVYEYQMEYSSDDVNQQWQLLAYGGNEAVIEDENAEIKQ